MAFSKQALGRISALLLAIGFLILLMVGGLSLYLAQRTRAYTDSVTALQSARVVTTFSLRMLQDAETGQRGYLLTHESGYLKPYRDAATALPRTLIGLQQQLGVVAGSESVLRSLLPSIGRKMAELEQTIALEAAGDHAGALAKVHDDSGKNDMDQIRADIDLLLNRIDQQRMSDRAALLTRSTMLMVVTWAGLVLVLLVAIVAAVVVVRYMRENEAAQHEIATANTRLEERVRERTADLQEANDEIQRFAYIVSHDLRAPLVNIMGFTAELQTALESVEGMLRNVEAQAPNLAPKDAQLAVREDLPEALNFIRTSTQRMDRLINAILKLSREGRRNLTPERVPMETMLRNIVTSVQHQLDEADARIALQTPIPDLTTDRLALEQVFGNLIDNAVKYLQPGRPGRITVRGTNQGGQLRFDVQDNGRGIEAKDRARVFELFRRAGVQDRPGEGIGLAHVRALVRRMGGTIDFASQPGEGTTFTVMLPRTLPT